ncbi:MAG: hypothetical protein WDM86_11215 [Rhizomicrobium sp.]
MLKNPYVVPNLLVVNLRYAADTAHAGGLAHGLAVAALAFMQTGEVAYALWLASLGVLFATALLRAIYDAWRETVREFAEPPVAPAVRRRRTVKPPTPPPPKRKSRKAKASRR